MGFIGDELFVVEDARADVRFFDNPLVTGATGIVLYAGMPLTTSGGHRIGMICVQHQKPLQLDTVQKYATRMLRI
jgi:GAF domain-containing protein